MMMIRRSKLKMETNLLSKNFNQGSLNSNSKHSSFRIRFWTNPNKRISNKVNSSQWLQASSLKNAPTDKRCSISLVTTCSATPHQQGIWRRSLAGIYYVVRRSFSRSRKSGGWSSCPIGRSFQRNASGIAARTEGSGHRSRTTFRIPTTTACQINSTW